MNKEQLNKLEDTTTNKLEDITIPEPNEYGICNELCFEDDMFCLADICVNEDGSYFVCFNDFTKLSKNFETYTEVYNLLIKMGFREM